MMMIMALSSTLYKHHVLQHTATLLNTLQHTYLGQRVDDDGVVWQRVAEMHSIFHVAGLFQPKNQL